VEDEGCPGDYENDLPSIVAVKPCAVSSKGDEVSKRDIVCSKLTVRVSHEESFLREGREDSSIAAPLSVIS
jgi:hypothetical protein